MGLARATYKKKYIKKAELLGSAHVEHRIGPGWILSVSFSIGGNFATLDCQVGSDVAWADSKWPKRQSRRILVINVYDHSRRKVAIVSLWRPTFDLMFLVTKRSQMEICDHLVTNSGGHKLTYFL